MISIQSVKQQYNGSVQIDFRNWEINSGEHWLMLGGSGTGKTTLLHIISGLLKPTSGSVNIEGTDLYNLRGAELDHFRGKILVLFFSNHT